MATSHVKSKSVVRFKQTGCRHFLRHPCQSKEDRLTDEAFYKVDTYEQTKKRLSCFYPERQTEDGGVHKKPLNL